MMESVTDGAILTIDVEGVIAIQNGAARALIGDATGRRLVECVPEADQPALGDAVAAARAGRAADLRLRLRTPGGAPKKLNGRILPLLRPDRTLEALLLVARE